MPTTDDYLAAIDAKRDKGDTAKVDFSQLPQGVDGGKIAAALSKGLPDDYSKEIQNRLQSKSKISLNYGVIQVKKSVPDEIWNKIKEPVMGALGAVAQRPELQPFQAPSGLPRGGSTIPGQVVQDATKAAGATLAAPIRTGATLQAPQMLVQGKTTKGLEEAGVSPLMANVGGMAAGALLDPLSYGGATKLESLAKPVSTGESVLRILGEGRTIQDAAKELGVPEDFARNSITSNPKAPLSSVANAVKGALPVKEGIPETPAEPIDSSNHSTVSKALSGDAPSQMAVMKQAYEKYSANLKKILGPAGEVLGFQLDGSKASSTAHNLFDRRFGDIGVGLFEAGLFRRDVVRGLSPIEKQAIPFVIEGKIPQADRFVNENKNAILELAKNPSPAMKEAISKIGPYLKEGHEFLKDVFDDIGFKENYISHLWDRGAEGLFGPGKQSLSKYNPFTKARWIGSYAEGINMGMTPKTLDIEQILEHYDNFKVRSVANAKFTQNLKDLDVLKSIDKAPADWVRVDNPALARKQFIPGKEGEPGFFLLRPVAVHPDFAPAVNAIISKPFSNEGIRAIEMFNAAYKKSLFSFSLFHHFTLGTIDVAAGGNPFKIIGQTFSKRLEEAGMGEQNPFKFIFGKGEDGVMNAKKVYQSFRDGHAGYDNVPLARDAIGHGLNVNPLSDAQVGRVRKGIISMEQAVKNIPVVGTAAKVLRTYDELFDKGLWSYWHAGVKLDLYERHLAENLEKFPNLPVEEVKRQTAEFVNNAAGGALDGMMVSPKFQQTLHWLFMAPDFLLTRLNSFASMFKGGPVGYQARKMWLKAAVGYYTAANVMNYVNTQKAYGKGQYMWQNDSDHQLTPFLGRVPSGPGKGRQQFEKLDKAFTEPLEIIQHPKKVLGNKFSPYLNAMALFWTGRTMSGYKPPEDVTPGTYVKQSIPMTLRGASEYGIFPKVAGMSQTELSTRLADAIDKKDKKAISSLLDTAKKNGYDGSHIERQVRRILTDEKKKQKVQTP